MNPANRTDEVCHRVRRAGLVCWAKLRPGGLLAGEILAFILPSLHHQRCLAMKFVECRRQGVSVRMLWVKGEELEFQ